jgi:hypothetical protein
MELVTVITGFLFRLVGRPEAMSDVNDDASEGLDEDELPEEYPPEQPYGVNERLTPEEEQVGESFEARTRRERPDRLGEDEGRVGTLVAPGGDEGDDDEADEVAFEIRPHTRRDQLDAGDPGFGGDLRDFAADREEVIPAEEAAMHLTDDPPMDDDDGYVSD